MPTVPSTDVRIRITATAASARRTFDDLDRRLRRPRLNMEKLNLQFRRLDRIWTLIAVGSGAAIIKTFVGMASELQKTQLQIAAFTRDLSAVPAIMDSMIALTEKVPFSLNTMTSSFVRLKSAGLDPIVDAQGNGPLKDLADAVAAFGGGDEIFKRATIAIQQMAGKGVISMEELRQQLGEAIPTAMRIMAEQMGISVSKLITEVSKGNVEFQAGIDALFKGFREKFGGAGELLKTTFTGQLQQARLEFEKLSKVIVLDSGALDFLTSALKMFNEQLNSLGTFLKSPKGSAAIADFWSGVEKVAIFAAQASGPLLNLIDIIGSMASVLIGITGALPAELAGGGILGFMLFGRAGVIPGAIFGLFSDEISAIAGKIAGWAGGIIGLADSLGLTNTLIGGLIGFLLFGPMGGLIGIVVGVLDILVQKFTKAIANLAANIAGGLANMAAQFKAGIESPEDILFDNAAIIAKGKEAGDKARKAFMSKFTGEGTFFGNLDTGLIAELKGIIDAQDKGSGASAKAEAAIKKFMASVKSGVPAIQNAREKIVAMFSAIKDVGGLSPAQLTTVQKLGSVLERLREQAEGGGTQLGRFQAGLRSDLAKLDSVIAQVTKTISGMAAGDSKIAGLKKELGDLVAMRDQMEVFGQTIIKNMGEQALGKIEPRIKRISDALNQFITTGSENTPLLEERLDKVRSKFSGIQKTIGDLRREVVEKTVADEEQARILAILDALTSKLNKGLSEQLARTREVTAAQQERNRLAGERSIRQAQDAISISQMENDFNTVGIAMQKAQSQAETMRENVEKNINRLRKLSGNGLTPEDADAQIAMWQHLMTSIQESSAETLERLKFNASDWGKALNSIAQSLEDNFANALVGLVDGTSTAREALLSFYADITRAAAKYLAKQALMKTFGAGGGEGGGFGSFIQSGVSKIGGLLGFAGGGSMMLGGAGGVDSNILSLNGQPISKVSRGEMMTIDPTGGGGGRGDQYAISISAVDAPGVRALFHKEGSALIAAMNARQRLNRR